MVDLSDFIYQAISEISDGIMRARKDLKEKGVLVNPSAIWDFDILEGSDLGNIIGFTKGDRRPVSIVHFDIGLQVTESKGARGGMKVKVGVLGKGIEGEAGGHSIDQSSSESRLQFSVPVILPGTTDPNKGNL